MAVAMISPNSRICSPQPPQQGMNRTAQLWEEPDQRSRRKLLIKITAHTTHVAA